MIVRNLAIDVYKRQLLFMAERFLNLSKRFLQKTKSEIRKQNPKNGSRIAYFCSFFSQNLLAESVLWSIIGPRTSFAL